VADEESQTRIATYLTLRDNKGDLAHVINTHYDDGGEEARAQSSLLIRKEAIKWVNAMEEKYWPGQKGVVILLGDFSKFTPPSYPPTRSSRAMD
jgi:endonuclease/exonuclease/phosphatase family metal-dependent hydrolase